MSWKTWKNIFVMECHGNVMEFCFSGKVMEFYKNVMEKVCFYKFCNENILRIISLKIEDDFFAPSALSFPNTLFSVY